MSTPSQPQRAHSAPQPKSRLNYVLDAPLPTPPSFSTLSLHDRDRAPPLPALHPPTPALRARSADTALPPIAAYPHHHTPLPSSPPHFTHHQHQHQHQHQQHHQHHHHHHPTPHVLASSRSPSTSALSDTPVERLSSGILTPPPHHPTCHTDRTEHSNPPTPHPHTPTLPTSTSPSPAPPASMGKRHKTEAELRDKRELRRMKNRISAARSRQRKTDTFETLQRELGEAKKVIEALTLQLDGVRSGTGRQGVVTIAVPHDLRRVVGRDFVSADMLMDVLRYYVAREGGGV